MKLHYYSCDYASKSTIIFWIVFYGKYFVKSWISRNFMQSSNMSFVVEPMYRRQLVKSIVCLEKVQLAIAQYRFRLRNFVLGISALKMNHADYCILYNYVCSFILRKLDLTSYWKFLSGPLWRIWVNIFIELGYSSRLANSFYRIFFYVNKNETPHISWVINTLFWTLSFYIFY